MSGARAKLERAAQRAVDEAATLREVLTQVHSLIHSDEVDKAHQLIHVTLQGGDDVEMPLASFEDRWRGAGVRRRVPPPLPAA